MHNFASPYDSRCFPLCIKYPAFKTVHPPIALLTSVLQTLEPQNSQRTMMIPRLPASTSRLSLWFRLPPVPVSSAASDKTDVKHAQSYWAEVFAFSVCSCKSPPFVRLEGGFLPAGLCKLLEIKDYIISYHSSILVSFLLFFSLSAFTVNVLVIWQDQCTQVRLSFLSTDIVCQK